MPPPLFSLSLSLSLSPFPFIKLREIGRRREKRTVQQNLDFLRYFEITICVMLLAKISALHIGNHLDFTMVLLLTNSAVETRIYCTLLSWVEVVLYNVGPCPREKGLKARERREEKLKSLAKECATLLPSRKSSFGALEKARCTKSWS